MTSLEKAMCSCCPRAEELKSRLRETRKEATALRLELDDLRQTALLISEDWMEEWA